MGTRKSAAKKGQRPAVEANAEWVVRFLFLPQTQAFGWVVRYKSVMIDQGLSEATINRRLSALRALVHQGRLLGVCGSQEGGHFVPCEINRQPSPPQSWQHNELSLIP